MSQSEHFDVVILGSGQGGKLLAWHLGRSGKRLPSWSAAGSAARARRRLPAVQERNLERTGRPFRPQRRAVRYAGGDVKIDMRKVRSRKQDMIDREIAFHLGAYKSSGAELIMGSGRFSARKRSRSR